MIAEKKINPVIRWAGSKAKVAKEIIKIFPEHDMYVEPFCGTVSVLLAKKPVKTEIINDVDSEIFNLYKTLIFDYDRFIEKVKWLVSSDELFKHFKALEDPSDLMKAVRFYYLCRFGFVPSFDFQITRTTAVRTVNLETLENFRKRMLHVQIHNRDFKSFLPTVLDKPTCLMYLDPPYYDKGDNFYNHTFSHGDHEILSEMLSGVEGKFVLSYDDCPEVRSLYSWAKIRNLKVHYSMPHYAKVNVNELLITNY